MKLIIKDNLKNESLKDLFLFVEQYCDKFSIEGSNFYTGAMTKTEFDEMYKTVPTYPESLHKVHNKDIITTGPQLYDINHPDLLYRTLSTIGVTSIGAGLYYNAYFILGQVYKDVRKTIKNLFDYPYYMDEEFMNMILYSGNVQMLIIHNEYQEAILSLSKEQYQVFLKLNIEHEEFLIE